MESRSVMAEAVVQFRNLQTLLGDPSPRRRRHRRSSRELAASTNTVARVREERHMATQVPQPQSGSQEVHKGVNGSVPAHEGVTGRPPSQPTGAVRPQPSPPPPPKK